MHKTSLHFNRLRQQLLQTPGTLRSLVYTHCGRRIRRKLRSLPWSAAVPGHSSARSLTCSFSKSVSSLVTWIQ